MLPQAASEFYLGQQRLIVATLGLTRATWSRMRFEDLDGSWSSVGPVLERVVSNAQLGAARNGSRYVGAALDELGQFVPPQAGVNPAAFSGFASDGRPLGSLLEGAKVRAKDAQSLAAGGAWLDMTAHTLVQDAGRQAAGVDMFVRPGVGFVRAVNPPCCQRCAVLAGKYSAPTAFLRHPRCDCFAAPVRDGESIPGLDVGPDDVKDLSRAQRRAIDDGADMGQVINSRRGGRGMYTTEGATRRGIAGRSLGAGRGRRAVRLTPEGIYRTAGSRDEALALLRQHGYILDAARPSAARALTVRSARTTSEVASALTRSTGLRVDGFGAAVDVEKARAVASTVERLAAEFPEVRAAVRVVDIDNPKVYAQASGEMDGRVGVKNLELQLSSSRMARSAQTDSAFAEDARAGYFNAGDGVDAYEYMVAHEWGHLVDFASRGESAAGYMLDVDQVRDALLASEGISGRGVGYLRWLRENTSGYGRTNRQELVAEAFADVWVNGEAAKPLSRAIYDALLSRLRGSR